METESALVRSDSAVELHTVPKVGLDLAIIVDPSDTESKDTVRLDEPLDYLSLFEFRMLVVNILDGLEDLLHCLQIFFLCRVLGLETGHYFIGFHDVYVVLYSILPISVPMWSRCEAVPPSNGSWLWT